MNNFVNSEKGYIVFEEGRVNGVYSYYFTPTSIGTVGVVRCKCGAEFTFQDL